MVRELLIEIGLGVARVRDTGEIHARVQRVARERPPPGPDLQHPLGASKLAPIEAVIELPAERRRQGLFVALVDSLAIGRMDRIEEAEEEGGIDIVVGGDGGLVGIDLAEQERLEKAPYGDDRVPVVERGAERERRDHVAVQIDIAPQIRLADIPFVEAAQGLDGAIVAQAHVEPGLAITHVARRAVRKLEAERRLDRAHPVDEPVDLARGPHCAHVLLRCDMGGHTDRRPPTLRL